MEGTKQRIWISRAELERIKRIFHQHLGEKTSAHIPFDAVLPVLEKKEATRLIWCRTARSQIREWGLHLGVRNKQNAYLVTVKDALRWQHACAGLVPADDYDQKPPAEDDRSKDALDLSHLIPQRDPQYVLPDWATHMRLALQHGSKVLLSGPAGCGKSSLAKELAAEAKRPFLRLNLTGETSVSDLLGGYKIQGREMVYRYGPVPMAVKGGAWLCLDELDAALPAVLFALQGLLEDGGSLHIPDTNEWLKPHHEFRFIATANTVGKGDDSGLYAGTQTLNEAFLDRFQAVFQIDYLPPEQERQVILGKVSGIDHRVLDRMLKVADELRQALKDGVIYSSCSTRKLIAWAGKTVMLGSVGLAAKYAVVNKVSADDQRVIREVLQRHGLGGEA